MSTAVAPGVIAATRATLAELVALRGSVQRGVAGHAHKLAAGSGAIPGSHKGGPASRGMEFAESRPYRAGDDVRHIDWRQSARRGGTYTKLFQQERERPVQILVDVGASMRFGTRVVFKSVLAARAAALLAWQAAGDGDRVGGAVWDGSSLKEVQPRLRQQGVLDLLHRLAASDATASLPSPAQLTLAAALPAFRRSLRPGGTAIVLSDFDRFDADTASAVAALGLRNDVTLVHVYDAFESEAPPPGIYDVTDGQRAMQLDLRTESARLAHVAPYAARCSGLERLARHPRVRLLHLATHDSPSLAQACLWQRPA